MSFVIEELGTVLVCLDGRTGCVDTENLIAALVTGHWKYIGITLGVGVATVWV